MKEAMKLALEALKHSHAREPIWKTPIKDAIEALEEALAKQKQGEPVAWGWRYNSCGGAALNVLAVTETPEPTTFLKNVFAKGPFPLYATPQKQLEQLPQQRAWVGLTDAEKEDCLFSKSGLVMNYEDVVADAVEAKLKEKNGIAPQGSDNK